MDKDKEIKRKENKFAMKLLGMSVFKTDDVDTMFKGVLNENSDDDSDGGYDEEDKKIRKLLALRKLECFKTLRNKIDITESKITRSKLVMLVSLNLVEGPLYIVTLIEIIRLTKKIFITEI